ncbi:hypothetical protein C0J52_03671 [Blattella germanica]|nr:hypothetical protein C0J52_03671 [Blattella germanica]
MSNVNEENVPNTNQPDAETYSIVSRASAKTKFRNKLIAFGKRGEYTKFEWRSKLQLFHFLVAFVMTPDDLMRVEDPGGVYHSVGITMILIFMFRVGFSSCMLADVLLYIFNSVSEPWLKCGSSKNYETDKYICIPVPDPKEQGSDLWSEDPKARLSAFVYWRIKTLGTNDTETSGFGNFVIVRLVSLTCIWVVVFMLLILTLSPGKLDYVYFYGIQNMLVTVCLAQGGYMIIGSYLKPDFSASLCSVMVIGIHFISAITAYIYMYASIGILANTYDQIEGALHIQENDAIFATVPQALGMLTFRRLVTFLFFLQMCVTYMGNVFVLMFYCMDISTYKFNFIRYHIIHITILLIPLIVGAIYKAFKSLRKHNLVAVLKPETDWGPRDPEVRQIRFTFVPRMETRLKRRTYVCKHRCLIQSEYLKYLMAEEEKWFNIYTGKDNEFPHGESSDKLSDDDLTTVSISSRTSKSTTTSSTLSVMPLSPQDVARAIALIDDGRSLRYAARTIGAPYTTVQEAVKRFRETQSYSRRLDLAKKNNFRPR